MQAVCLSVKHVIVIVNSIAQSQAYKRQGCPCQECTFFSLVTQNSKQPSLEMAKSCTCEAFQVLCTCPWMSASIMNLSWLPVTNRLPAACMRHTFKCHALLVAGTKLTEAVLHDSHTVAFWGQEGLTRQVNRHCTVQGML